ncbi:stress response and cell division protein BolA [Acetobacter estunensis NRIC 0472]|uniref:BolA/IbaG family iron-sulfur metabolism protein n=1 Tax=Acetobacter estunensis TaxID=104097 RepID=A0A967B550_9PROT|nr:BolA family protein [Acetobacter estunensis]NHO53960.1 BolA/IbaG family iron-sulfur metabolism protein [Acetobacter estunensis]GBQ26785.1 stress response and cell division protein BolA [Acetobacter estunensis NRIC 0472]
MADTATGPRAQRVLSVLEEKLSPTLIELVDDSHRHAGHLDRPRGPQAGTTETHLQLVVVSDAFEGLSRVARSRLVHKLLDAEFGDGLHALALTLKTPAEAAR